MKFKINNLSEEIKHTSLVSCVAWLSHEQIYSCGDDHVILKWNTSGSKIVTKITELSEDIFPTSLHCIPRPSSSKNDTILMITSTDGKMILLSVGGRIEKIVEAHKAAILCSQLSRDGSSIVTGAEDGSVKVWSRSAMLRTTVASGSNSPVFACDWSPDSQVVTYAQGGSIILKPLSPSLTATKWQGHEGVILSLVWSSANPGILASGAEDCRYKIWDAEGRLLHSSTNQGSPVTALSWSWNAQLLAIGAHDSLRLCNSSGWSHAAEHLSSGGMHGLVWSKDNSQVAVACGTGKVISACVIDRRVDAGSIQAHMVSQQIVQVRDLETSDQWETLETKNLVLQILAGYGQVIIATSTQCLVYNLKSINTPTEIKLPGVFLLQITSKYILAVNDASYNVFTLEGRPVTLPHLPSFQPQTITEDSISLSPDTLAIRDHVDSRVIHLLEIGSSLRGVEMKKTPSLKFSEAVRKLALSQNEMERCLAVIGIRGDLYVTPNPSTSAAKTYKLGSMVRSLLWNNSNSYLAVLTENQLLVWFYPQIVGIDRNLLPNTVMERDLSELGSNANLVQFCGCILEVRRQDQISVYVPLNPAPAVLYYLTEKSQWEKALAMLRRVSPVCGIKPGCMHSLYAARCRVKMQPQRALTSYTALGCVDSIEMLLAQE